VFVGIVPARLLDTRENATTFDGFDQAVGRLDAGTTYELDIAGRAGVPTDALSVTANLVAVNPSGPGHLTVYPCGFDKPLASALNYMPGVNIANEFTVPIGDNGDICIYTYAETDIVVDIYGYYIAGSGGTGATGPQGPAGPVNRISDEQIATLAWYEDPGATATIDVGAGPNGVAYDGTNIYVTNSGSNNVSVIDPATNTVTDTVDVGAYPTGVAYDGTNIYVANSAGNDVSVIDPATNTQAGYLDVGTNPIGVAYDGTNIYVTNLGSSNVSKLIPR
jgi:YVTN family beta-propeller protein